MTRIDCCSDSWRLGDVDGVKHDGCLLAIRVEALRALTSYWWTMMVGLLVTLKVESMMVVSLPYVLKFFGR